MLFEPFLSFDNAVFQWIGSVFAPGTNAALDSIMRFITMLGDGGWFFIALAVLFMIPNKTRRIGLVMAFALVFDMLLVNIIMKPAFDRPRPYALEIDWWVQAYRAVFPAGPVASHLPSDMSFPSGHTGAAFAGMFAWCFASRKKWVGRARWVSYIGIAVAALVAFSRLYLGVHYPTDVIAGVLVALACAGLGMLLFRLIERGYNKVNAPLAHFAQAHLPKIFW